MLSKEWKEVIVRLQEIQSIFERFSTKEEALKFLIKETKLSKEECALAYDFFMKINLHKE